MWIRQGGAVFELSAGFDDEEEGAEAHWTEVPAEERFAIGANIGDEVFESEDDRDAAEAENQDQQTNEFAGGDVGCIRFRGGEEAPRDDRAKIDEHAAVEEEIEDVGKVCLTGFLRKPAVPCKAVACAECNKEVVNAEGGGNADAEEG